MTRAARAAAAAIVLALAALGGLGLSLPTAASADEPAPFPGTVDGFYVVPDPLPPGAPGELIRVQPMADDGQVATVRIMYHSIDAAGRDRAVTGVVTYPTSPAPPDGRPVVSLAPGTSGLASPCATSRTGAPAPRYGLDAVGVRTDYIGLGPPGDLQPYLSRLSEGHAVIDAVRAARHLSAAGAGDEWFSIGHSQGGHGALSAAELAAGYAPELDLLGTVAIAPAAMLDRTYGPIDRIVANIVGVMALYGAPTEHPEIDPDDYVGPQTAAVAAAVLPTSCIDTIIEQFLTVPPDQFYVHDPAQTEPAASLLVENDVGNVRADEPLLLLQGTADPIVSPARTADLFARLCTTGQVTDYRTVEGADHGTILGATDDAVALWLQQRLADEPAVDTCLAAQGSTTTTPPTSTTAAALPAPATPAFTG
ncbi:MAG: prolyl oligopeptidase family serine peptidase [Acidimicrobiales bacterium]|nr:prolyl oligopeptidase family serine peptidase [Acidimicrobiales bacterium]MCB1251381.1 prolyl oligopeptidase family serine peptidase [Acidimicrobiales bacterium]